MQDDKAKAFFILSDADAIDRKIAASVHKLLVGYEVQQMNNQRDLGNALFNNFAVQNRIKDYLLPFIEDTLVQNLVANLRMETYLDPHHENLHIRLSYKSQSVSQQTVNLRRY